MRVLGIDFARALAIIGMIIVNFKMVIGAEGSGWLLALADSFSGKAAALFVTLAGVGIALMTQRGYESNDETLIKKGRVKLIKRSILLFVVGLSYIVIWPADILHFYGVYIEFTMVYVLVFSLLSILFSNLWLKYFKSGPIEWLFNKIISTV